MVCEKCGIEHNGTYGSGRFCSRKCSSSRPKTEESKQKTSASLKGRTTRVAFVGENACECCNKPFAVNSGTRKNRYCSALCANTGRKTLGRINGLKSASVTHRRSKNEIMFADMCKTAFGDILTNEPIFNGWDADVILPNHKIAILWNGPWHYRKLTKKHSVEQVQNRDRIKLLEIGKAGYRSYVIRDDGSHNRCFVAEQFEQFIRWYGIDGCASVS